jgi:hypothetical protein
MTWLPGDTKIAHHCHQCVICLRAVDKGDQVTAAANDLLAAGHMVWCHPLCAQWHILINQSSPLMSVGWERLARSQFCGSCRKLTEPGGKTYRVVEPAMTCYRRDCESCVNQ